MNIINYVKKNRNFFIVIFLVSALWGVLLSTVITSSHNYRNEIIEIETIREREHYESVLNNTFKKMEAIKVFVDVIEMDNITEELFRDFVENMDYSEIGFLSMNIAPDGVIAFYYSEILDENDLIGYNFFDDERQAVIDAINYTIENDVIVVNAFQVRLFSFH